MFRFTKKMDLFNALKRKIPTVLASDIRNFFLASFRNQGFTDTHLEKWKNVKRREEGTKEFKYPKKKGLSRRTKPINTMTGRLRKSIVVKYATFNKIVVGTSGVDYAAYVNEARPFMGDSKILRQNLRKKLTIEMSKVLRAK